MSSLQPENVERIGEARAYSETLRPRISSSGDRVNTQERKAPLSGDSTEEKMKKRGQLRGSYIIIAGRMTRRDAIRRRTPRLPLHRRRLALAHQLSPVFAVLFKSRCRGRGKTWRVINFRFARMLTDANRGEVDQRRIAPVAVVTYHNVIIRAKEARNLRRRETRSRNWKPLEHGRR